MAIRNCSMRLWTWSFGSCVLVIALLIATRSAVAEAPSASLTPIESASSGNLFGRLTSPLGAAHSSKDTPIQTVAVPPRKSISFPRSSPSMLHPKAPNIHTRPKKQSKMWWPFGHK
jgi:hypothetical protein